MKSIFKISSAGHYGGFDGEVLIESEKYDQLSKETRSTLSFNIGHEVQRLQHKINLEWVKEFESEKRLANIQKMLQLFKDAGFKSIHHEIIENQYSGDAGFYNDPWLIVTTPKGRITIGWRKRVINLDWSDSDIKADGNELFKGEKTTTGKNYIHCWSYDKAIEYLTKLNKD